MRINNSLSCPHLIVDKNHVTNVLCKSLSISYRYSWFENTFKYNKIENEFKLN